MPGGGHVWLGGHAWPGGVCMAGGMRDTHVPPPGQILRLRHTVNERPVRILLECILVGILRLTSHKKRNESTGHIKGQMPI